MSNVKLLIKKKKFCIKLLKKLTSYKVMFSLSYNNNYYFLIIVKK